MTALSDLFFTEGTEKLSLEFVPPAGVEATLGEPLRITLVDAGASPCPGVTVIGLPWHEEESPDEDVSNMLATTLNFELGGGSAGTRLEFLGPYLDLGTWGRIEESVAVFGINRWESTHQVGRHRSRTERQLVRGKLVRRGGGRELGDRFPGWRLFGGSGRILHQRGLRDHPVAVGFLTVRGNGVSLADAQSRRVGVCVSPAVGGRCRPEVGVPSRPRALCRSAVRGFAAPGAAVPI